MTGPAIPTAVSVLQDLAPRLRKRVIVGPHCWHWRGYPMLSGYGRVMIRGRAHYAHRVVYEALVGPIPDGLVIDHTCRNRICVNPSHLRAVTPRINALENSESVSARNAAKTHCKRGHPFDETNTWWRTPTARQCRTCRREAELARYHRKAAKS